MMEEHIENLIANNILVMTLSRHQHLKAIEQTIAFATYPTQSGVSGFQFRAIVKYKEMETTKTHQIIALENDMIITEGDSSFHKQVAANMASNKLHDGTRAALSPPFTIDLDLRYERIPFKPKRNLQPLPGEKPQLLHSKK